MTKFYKKRYIKENLDESTCEEIAREFTDYLQSNLDEYAWVDDLDYWQTSYGGCFECDLSITDPVDDTDYVYFHIESITGNVKVKQTDGTPVTSPVINKVLRAFENINDKLVSKWFFDDDLYESRRPSRRCRRMVRESYKTVTQKYIKDAIRDFGAIDITNYSFDEADKLYKKCDFDVVATSSGVYGLNGALLKDLKTGKLYAITARNSVLSQLV